ncbi:hypothetical protein EXS74_01155 [Candidatus Woesearchaeota archaeon]|nr:hypothetical protein [Candidatus Woesearchaeota archaeon]
MGKKTVIEKTYQKVDPIIIQQLKKYSLHFLQYSLAIVFIWLGALKLIGFSPATELVTNTIYWFSPTWFIPFLGIWEVLIGLCLLYKPFLRIGLFLMAIQMGGTFLPLILLPQIVYTNGNPFYLTIEGQYIIKNLVLITAAMVIGSHVRDKK